MGRWVMTYVDILSMTARQAFRWRGASFQQEREVTLMLA